MNVTRETQLIHINNDFPFEYGYKVVIGWYIKEQ